MSPLASAALGHVFVLFFFCVFFCFCSSSSCFFVFHFFVLHFSFSPHFSRSLPLPSSSGQFSGSLSLSLFFYFSLLTPVIWFIIYFFFHLPSLFPIPGPARSSRWMSFPSLPLASLSHDLLLSCPPVGYFFLVIDPRISRLRSLGLATQLCDVLSILDSI